MGYDSHFPPVNSWSVCFSENHSEHVPIPAKAQCRSRTLHDLSVGRLAGSTLKVVLRFSDGILLVYPQPIVTIYFGGVYRRTWPLYSLYSIELLDEHEVDTQSTFFVVSPTGCMLALGSFTEQY